MGSSEDILKKIKKGLKIGSSADLLKKVRLELKPGESTIIATGIGANNCLYHAVLGFHVRQYEVLVPLDCTHSSKPMGMKFLKWQMNQGAYNFNVKLTSSSNIIFD